MRSSRFQQVAVVAIGVLIYALLGGWSLRLALTQANASAVWPLAGLVIGALARFGFRYWPIVFVGAFATNFHVNVQHGVALPASALAAAGIAFGNTAEALVGAWLARRALGCPPEFRSVEDVFRFVWFVCLMPPVLSAGCGALSLHFAGILPTVRLGPTAFTWFTGNVAGILTCAPLFFIGSFRVSPWKLSRRGVAEWVVAMVLLVLVGQTISGNYFAEVLAPWPKSYMAIPLVLWIAFRFGRRGVVLGVLLLMATGIAGTMRGFAAFPSDSPEQSLLSLQLFLGVVIVIGLTVSVLVDQLRRQRKALESALVEKSIRLAAITQEKAILTASSVHGLQSPLSGMRNLLQLIRRTPEIFAGPEGDRLLGDMLAAVEHMFGLVTGALSVARHDGGVSVEGDLTRCDLTALLHRVVETKQAHADSKRIRLRQSMPVWPIMMVTRGPVVELIVDNFLSNAVKFSSPGASIFIDLEQTASEVTISVTDEGPGIPERDRATIFSGGIRSHAARPTGGEASSGMGLYLVGELAQRLGARVGCVETRSGGSVFSVVIPNPDHA